MGRRRAAAPRGLWLSVVGVVLLSLQGCGFHLRGAQPLPPAMARTYVAGDGASDLVRDLKLDLQAAGVKVVAAADQASAVLHVLSVQRRTRVLSVDINGQVRQYELSLAVEFSVTRADGARLFAPQRLVVVRHYSYNANQLLAEAGEADFLRREMNRDLVRAMLRRLRYAKPS
jgi:LPS-assembly lipoprotein